MGSPFPSPGSRNGGLISQLAERSSIGLRRPSRRFSTEEGCVQTNRRQDDEDDKKHRPSSSRPSLFYLLHVKFAFQISNTIYESLFAQHLQQRLRATPEQLGWMMSAVGLQAALVNGMVVPRLISNERDSNWVLLILCSVGQMAGTVLWALALSLHSSFAGAVIIGLSSNVFLSLLQGMLGTSRGSSSSGNRQPNSGLVYGLSTVMDRGARALAPLIAAASLQAHFSIPTIFYHFIGRLGPGAGAMTDGGVAAGLALSAEEAEALSVVHANEVLGLALVCATAGLYTICLLSSWYITSPGALWRRGRGERPIGLSLFMTDNPSPPPGGRSGYPTTP